ncbi:unnamed protein product [Prorocentrum cordatum]|uniref:Protochlorophyllide reductase n=1 Tax=Prorocentrum cordatum TaxID=2364126 RepID=A0ABN9SJ05_9DINO|nr:unnamed protein product [Polarella glacialis]
MAGVEVAGRHAAFGERMYEASKLANLCFARSLRAKVGSRGITVIAMTPGQVNTDLNAFDLVNVSVPAELGGEKLFESAFADGRKPTPDFVYPYWFPRLVFEGEVPEVLAPWRITEAGSWGRPLDNAFRPERLLQQRDFTLHGSVGPECGEQLQRSLWRWRPPSAFPSGSTRAICSRPPACRRTRLALALPSAHRLGSAPPR